MALDEAPGDAVRRLAQHGADPDTVRVMRGPVTLADVRARVAHDRPALVVIDTISRLWGAESPPIDENDAGSVQPFLHRVSDLARDYECAVVGLHHTGRNARRYRGSSAIEAVPDAVLMLTRRAAPGDAADTEDGEPGDGGASSGEPSDETGVRLLAGIARWGEVRMAMRYDGGRYVVGDGAAPLADRVLFAVLNSEGRSRDATAQAVGGRKERALAELAEHVKAGRIENRGSGNRSALYATDAGRAHVRAVRPDLAALHLPGDTAPDEEGESDDPAGAVVPADEGAGFRERNDALTLAYAGDGTAGNDGGTDGIGERNERVPGTAVVPFPGSRPPHLGNDPPRASARANNGAGDA